MNAIPPATPREDWNTRLTRFFLERSRLTVLLLLSLLGVGYFTASQLKTTGFPAVSLSLVQVRTVYPGATSETVAEKVTKPLEGKLKGVSGVKTFSSSSSSSFSIITVTLDSGADTDAVSTKITAALSGLSLPAGTQKPEVQAIAFDAPTFTLSVAGTDLSRTYAAAERIRRDVGQLAETASVTEPNELREVALVSPDVAKLTAAGLSEADVRTSLKTVGSEIPVAADATLGGTAASIVIRLSGTGIGGVAALPLTASVQRPAGPAPAGSTFLPSPTVQLGDVASVRLEYRFATEPVPMIGGAGRTFPAVTLDVSSAKGTDSAAYAAAVGKILTGYGEVAYSGRDPVATDAPQIVVHSSADRDNQEQVTEVKQGLIGGPLPISGPIKYAGWLLGGVQLVFLAMMFLVSWRAAVVSALAIPLSLLFATISLRATGNTLNTIVLFSLVLAIGLVVDPALVIVEAIQRKIDTGMRGKEAVLAAVKDVGTGLFIATLTNVIVFLPFGLISGFLGQIFSNIPAAILPAVIGSYAVPIVFLSYGGGSFLRPAKRKGGTEEENLWPLAKALIRFNERVLRGGIGPRAAIISLAVIAPLAVAGYFLGTGKVAVSQFSGAGGKAVAISGSFKAETSKEDRQQLQAEVLEAVAGNPQLGAVYASAPQGLAYRAYPKDEKASYGAAELAADVERELAPFRPRFFDLRSNVEGVAGPDAAYQVQVAVFSEDEVKLKAAAQAVGADLAKACQDGSAITFEDACAGTRLVAASDDGYTGKEVRTVEVLLDRAALSRFGLDPQGFAVAGALGSLYSNRLPDAKDGSVRIDGQDVEILLADPSTSGRPRTVQEVRDLPVLGPVKLGQIASVTERSGSSSIEREKGRTQGLVRARLVDGKTDQGTAGQLTAAITARFQGARAESLGLASDGVKSYEQGGASDFAKSFLQLVQVLLLAIVASYLVLAVFFNSLLQPLVILFTIPLTFIGVFPALYYLGPKQFGFFEIIGTIILIGIVENVAIFLIDAARQLITEHGTDEKRAIAYASGVRLRPVILTTTVALASLAPLAILSPFYRSISLVIMFGLVTSGALSLFTTPILFVFFRWLSRRFEVLSWYNKVLFFPFFPVFILLMAYWGRNRKLVGA